MSEQQHGTTGTYYRAYFVAIPSGFFSKREATECLEHYKSRLDYNEMDDVTRVYLSDFEGLLHEPGHVNVQDANGNHIKVNEVTKALIRNAGGASRSIIQSVLANPKKVTRNIVGGLTQLTIENP
jgi:hypothetical protein